MSRDTSFASCMMAAYALDVHGNASAQARHAVAVAKVVSPRYLCHRALEMAPTPVTLRRAELRWLRSMLPFKSMGQKVFVLTKCWLHCKCKDVPFELLSSTCRDLMHRMRFDRGDTRVRYAGMRCLRLADGPDEVCSPVLYFSDAVERAQGLCRICQTLLSVMIMQVHLDTIAKLHLSRKMSKL
jgi:hypothetical protein